MGKNILTKISLLLISCIFSLLLMEIIVRIFLPQRIETPVDFYSSDELLIWTSKPNFNKLYSSADFQMNVSTNEKGFRGVSHDYEKPPETFRIVGIGDSFLFGFGVDNQDTVLVRLQELLGRDNSSAKKVEIINLGVGAYSINHYLRILKYEVYKYDPDLVMVFFYSNDWRANKEDENWKVDDRGFLLSGAEEFSFKSVRSFLLPLRVFLKNHSQLYMLVRDRFTTILTKTKLMHVPLVDLYRKNNDLEEKFSHTFEVIDQINEFIESNLNCPFVLCIIPEKVQIDEVLLNTVIQVHNIENSDYDWSRPQAALIDFCLREKIKCLDLTPSFRDQGREEKLYFDIDIHWNQKGHLLAAEEIHKFLKSNNLL